MAKMAQGKKETEKTKVAAKKKEKSWPVKMFVTHNRPHFDEVLAIFFLKKWGERHFPGVGDAGVEAWADGGLPPEFKKAGKTADQLLVENGILAIGTCGGIFDEHGKKAPTCAHLVVDYLKISGKPELLKILQFCKRVDHDGHSMPFDIHSLMKEMYDFHGDDDEGLQTVLDWAMQAIESYIFGQQQFHICEKDYRKTGKIITINSIRICLVESDNSKMNKWIRWKFGSPEIIIQRRKTGHTIILISPLFPLPTIEQRDIRRVVRAQEQRKREMPVSSWQELEADGESKNCPWWFSYGQGGQLLNGSLTALDSEPTLLSLDDITRAIASILGPLPDFCSKVRRCIGKECERQSQGLIFCRKRRFKEKTAGAENGAEQ